MDRKLSRFRSVIARRLAIDVRALAAFRISLGIVLLIDLVLRLQDIQLFYTDAGVLPVSFLAEKSPIYARISIHALSGEMWYQILLFSVAVALAIGLIIGYHTRIVTLGSFVLLVSLHARNPYVLNGGDALLQHLLFWSLFLPLGTRWSIDARRAGLSVNRIFSVASAGLLIQVLVVYGVNAVLKLRSDHWMSGEAVSIVFALDRFTILLGPLFSEIPLVLELTNWIWIVLLAASPLLILSRGRIRMALVGAFAGMHFGMLLTMNLGIFPLVSIIALVPFVPTGFWDRFEGPDSKAAWRRLNSKYFSLNRSRFSVGVSRYWLLLEQQLPVKVSQTIPALALIVIILFNAIAVGVVPAPQSANNSLSGDRLDSRWALFAPNPPTTERWFVANGNFTTSVKNFQISWTESWWNKSETRLASSSARLRKYMSHIRFDRSMSSSFARYLCGRWDGAGGGQLVSVSISAVEKPIRATFDSTQKRSKLVEVPCKRSL